MNREKWDVISPFCQTEPAVGFVGAYLFRGENKNLLMESCGHIIILDDEMLSEIEQHQISGDLAFKLIQRGFVQMKDHPIPCDCDEFKIATHYFMIDITQKCNMRCRYCLRDDAATDTISLEKAEDICNFILKHCQENQINEIVVQAWGGEPLLAPQIVYFIDDFFKSHNIKLNYTIETNGSILTKDLVKELYRRGIHIGISIDGNQDIQDKQRTYLNGNPTYKDVTRGIRLLREQYGDDFGSVSVVTKNSVSCIDQVITHFVKDLGLKHIKLNLMRISDFIDNADLYVDIADVPAYIDMMMNTIVKLLDEGYQFEEINVTTKMLNLINNQKSNLCISRGCNGGKAMVTISREGEIYPCELSDYPEECLGGIYDGIPLVDIVKNAMETHTYFQEKIIEECKQCPWKYYCRGGCTSHVKTQGLQPPEIDKLECAVNKALYPRLVEIILSKPDIANKIIGYQVLD